MLCSVSVCCGETRDELCHLIGSYVTCNLNAVSMNNAKCVYALTTEYKHRQPKLTLRARIMLRNSGHCLLRISKADQNNGLLSILS